MARRALFFASDAHFDGVSGGRTHTLSVLRLLRALPEISLDTVSLAAPFASAPPALRRAAAVTASITSSLPSKSCLLLGHAAFSQARIAIERTRPEMLFLNGSDLLPLASLAPKATPILVAHNLETQVLREQSASIPAVWPVSSLLARDLAKSEALERGLGRANGAVLAISPEIVRFYEGLSPAAPALFLPTTFSGPGYAGPRPAEARPLRLGFIGKMGWWPNRRGIEWFLREVLPRLPKGTMELELIGPGSQAFAGQHPALNAKGFVEDLSEIWARVHFTICPIFEGSGTNVKVLESLHAGVPALVTPHARRGLDYLDDPALAVLPPEDWVTFLSSAAADELATRTPKAATRRALSADLVAKRLHLFLQKLAA